ncbi:hypothetical protein [Chromobacterium sp. ASV23]|uniref:hypothetical protein n=1 Tax=Chromobacterium sp. ASV23 TaxID=2795110 RepID=UPI0018ED9464|nr:hypothetical protein [Chromobacterium sp. ASV23]
MPTERVCLAATHNGNLAAARRCGFKTAFIPRPREFGPNQQTELMAEQDWDWDWVAGDMIEQAGMMGA